MPDERESGETEATETPEKAAKPMASVRPPTQLQRDSDRAVRPGFRNPPNTRSKAQKTAKKKRR